MTSRINIYYIWKMIINVLKRLIPYSLILLSIVLIGWFVFIAGNRVLTQLEIIFFQVFILISGLGGSYLIGSQTSKTTTREMIKPHVRSAFRRVMSLYRTLSRVAEVIDAPNPDNDAEKITIIKGIVVGQIYTADDALADWQDLDPESVKELRDKMHTRLEESVRNG